jgi:hypothetical protein
MEGNLIALYYSALQIYFLLFIIMSFPDLHMEEYAYKQRIKKEMREKNKFVKLNNIKQLNSPPCRTFTDRKLEKHIINSDPK